VRTEGGAKRRRARQLLADDERGDLVETEPAIKNQTASSSFKPALLTNGVRTMVPPHVVSGTRIVVMTEDGSYVERAKD
jgi:elongation factor P